MTPSLKVMPTVRTAWTPGKGYRLDLPGGFTKYARDREEARAIVARDAYGAALEFIGDRPKR